MYHDAYSVVRNVPYGYDFARSAAELKLTEGVSKFAMAQAVHAGYMRRSLRRTQLQMKHVAFSSAMFVCAIMNRLALIWANTMLYVI